MPFYRQVGEIPRKRHTRFRQPDGRLYTEELMGSDGFSAESALLYHRELPGAISGSEPWTPPSTALRPNHPLRPRHLRLPELSGGGDAVRSRQLVLGNRDVLLSYVAATESSPLHRNAIGDECVFVQAGEAVLETVFGAIAVSAGDFVVIPRGTTHRWVHAGELRLFCIEAASGHITPPRRYLGVRGQHLESSPYCERDLRAPGAPLLTDGEDVAVYVKHRGPAGHLGSVLRYPRHPFDVVGWDGGLYPFAFAVADFEPLTGRIHQPPPVHQVFEAAGFVICAFVPRKVDYHPLSIPVPYFHSNVDSDEVLFYVAGNYEARKGSGISAGSVSLHPGGHAHGPQPGAAEASLGVQAFDELAVMVDTFAPLEIGDAGWACEQEGYAWSWLPRDP